LQLNETCSIQGFNELKQKNISCEEKLSANRVDFSNGISRNLIQGEISVNNVDYQFSLVLDSFTVVDYTFDFIATDSSDFLCSFKKIKSNIYQIEWINKNKRVFLRKEVILEH